MTHRRRWRKNRKQKAAARNSKEQQATDYTGSRYCDSIYNKQQQNLVQRTKCIVQTATTAVADYRTPINGGDLTHNRNNSFFFCITSAATRVNNVVITGAAL